MTAGQYSKREKAIPAPSPQRFLTLVKSVEPSTAPIPAAERTKPKVDALNPNSVRAKVMRTVPIMLWNRNQTCVFKANVRRYSCLYTQRKSSFIPSDEQIFQTDDLIRFMKEILQNSIH